MPLLPLEVIDKPAVVIPFVAEAVSEVVLLTDLKNRSLTKMSKFISQKTPRAGGASPISKPSFSLGHGGVLSFRRSPSPEVCLSSSNSGGRPRASRGGNFSLGVWIPVFQ